MNIVGFRNAGRMGNFLFQAATTMAYAWKHQLEFTVPNTTKNLKHNPIYLGHLVHPDYRPEDPCVHIEEKVHTYQELEYQEEWRNKSNVTLHGYWQTEKYFLEYREQVLQKFAFPWKPLPGFVSVHVRRGDYLRLTTKHPPVPVSWIMKAMERFPGFHFIFFSDDIPWCKSVFSRRKDVSFSKGTNEVQDLIDMSQCDHHICSASTFSWWGMWLNQNPQKRAIFPKLWFQPGRKEDTKDIIPEWCERI